MLHELCPYSSWLGYVSNNSLHHFLKPTAVTQAAIKHSRAMKQLTPRTTILNINVFTILKDKKLDFKRS